MTKDQSNSIIRTGLFGALISLLCAYIFGFVIIKVESLSGYNAVMAGLAATLLLDALRNKRRDEIIFSICMLSMLAMVTYLSDQISSSKSPGANLFEVIYCSIIGCSCICLSHVINSEASTEKSKPS